MLGNTRHLLSRSRVLSHSVLIGLILALSLGFAPRAAWAQCNESNTLSASGGASNDQYGQSVAMSGNVIVVGNYLDDDKGTNSGSAYVYGFNGSTWVQEAKLLASDGQGADKFGIAVAVSGDVVVVGSHGDDDNGSNAGAAFVFRYNGSNWVQEQKLLASDGGAFNRFGASVAVAGDFAVIGAWQDDDKGVSSGSAYVFRFNGSSWVQDQKLLASDGAAPHQFGRSVGIDGEVIVVGADRNWANGSNSGSAYVFNRQGSNWVEQLRILASDGEPDDAFGSAVSISGGVLLIGAKATDDNGLSSGAAYVYRFNGANWIEEQKLLAPDGAAHDSFGASVGVSGNMAVVGAWAHDDMGTDSGSAYRYVFNGSTWSGTKLLVSDGAAGDAFGFSAAVSGDLAVVGAYGVDGGGLNFGAAYIFTSDCSSPDPGCVFNTDCNDGDGCTVDVCQGGTCTYSPKDCGDGNGCTFDFCSNGFCLHSDVPNATPCGSASNSVCDNPDSCQNGVCETNREPSGTPCPDDGNECTNDICNGSESCIHPSKTNGAACGSSLNTDCDNPDTCLSGSCRANLEPSGTSCSDDGNQCTDDTCNGSGSCTHPTASNGTGCNDGNDCTTNDVCASGTCQGEGMSCDDGDACTTDTCDTVTGCAYAPVSCDDGNLCTVDSCNSQSGCQFDPIVCQIGETCVNGVCESSSGCVLNTDCFDGNACTWDLCTGFGDCWNPAVGCNDSNACTVDTCNPSTGCVFDPIVCPIGQSCVDGTCEPSGGGCVSNSDCDDFEACTTDLCSSSGVCSNTPMTCDDGISCTVDSCSGGTCFFDLINCDDADDCTVDTCSGGVCSNNPIDCNDGDACTVDSCFGGSCFNDPISCDDGDACTDDMCVNGTCQSTFPECGLADGCCGPSCGGGGDPDCDSCFPSGSSCVNNSDCCSGKCKGKSGNKKCKGG